MDTRGKKELGGLILLVVASLFVYSSNRIFGFEATVLCLFTLYLWRWMKE